MIDMGEQVVVKDYDGNNIVMEHVSGNIYRRMRADEHGVLHDVGSKINLRLAIECGVYEIVK